MSNTRRINKECLTYGHAWDYYGHPNWVCDRKGCTVRAEDWDIFNPSAKVPITDSKVL